MNVLHDLGAVSCIVVPLSARGTTFGALGVIAPLGHTSSKAIVEAHGASISQRQPHDVRGRRQGAP